MNNFTGSILFENLDKNSYSKNYYINGSKIINAKSPVSTNSVLKPNYVVTECQTTAICTYFTNCNGYYVTAVSGVDFCPGEPIFIPSGCFSFNGWQYAGTEYRTSCHDVEYPDPPLGGSPTNITFPVSNPCAVKATTLSSPTWANTLNAAKDNWLALDHESAYTYTNINQLSTYSFQYGSRNEPFINLTVPVQITGMVHSHPTGIVDMNNNPVRMSPTPTPEDFAAIGTLFNTGKLAIPSTFTSTVITGLGSLYMISISDPNLFKTWMTTNFARDSDGVTLFEKNFTSLGNALLAGGGYSDRDAHETALLYYLQNSGIRMIRGDINNLYSSANWLPLNYNSSWYRTQATPCP
ncbi:hypothetical protein [uncultured Mucilaginibacter sp.]|uniref:hypothetical protein n=1 Tax=uncultured Mucilaginibacter sp. TaxID=797541 RepID=UPI0026263213|nr:hypothetical protein [uncultured Mucilaginibacter sp.]